MGVINFYTGQPGMTGPKKTTQEYIVKKKKKKGLRENTTQQWIATQHVFKSVH